MRRVLHVLPHRGGGAETYIDLLDGVDGYVHERAALSATREPLRSLPSIARNWPGVARRARRADLVHAHGDVASPLVLPLLRSRPSVVTTHGLHFLRRATGPRARAARAAMRAVIGAAAATMCTSEAERDELATLLGPAAAGRLVVVHNGVRLPPELDAEARRAARAALGVPGDEVVALYLGRLEERKDPLVAVEAARRARERGAPVALLVAGEGPLADEVAARSGPAVRPLGHRADPERLLTAADVLLLPSAREGLAMAALEAMAYGVATIVSDGPGNPEAVGDAGVVAPVGDVAAWTDALVELASDRERRDRLGAAGRARVGAQFGVERFRAGVVAAYDTALPPTAPGPAAAGAPA
jgi:glycosyltransferase involved in cell wall biosynthesis